MSWTDGEGPHSVRLRAYEDDAPPRLASVPSDRSDVAFWPEPIPEDAIVS